jgi:hypothetical protein
VPHSAPASYRKPRPSGKSAPLASTASLPLLVVFILDILCVIALAVVVTPEISLPWGRCIQPAISSWGLAIILVLLFHFIWRFLHQPLGVLIESLKIQGIQVAAKALIQVLNALHPWQLSNRALILCTVIPSLVIGVVGLSAWSPFYLPEGTPIVTNFSVKYPDGTPLPLKQGNAVEIKRGASVLVEAALDQSDLVCSWSAVNGTVQLVKDCAILYGPPLGGLYDTLTVKVQSACRTQQTYDGLQIRIVPNDP